MLLAASLLGKAVNHDGEAGARSVHDDQRRVQNFLTGHGWVPSGVSALLSDGKGPMLQFQVPRCFGAVRVGLLPPTGEMTILFLQAADPDASVFYTYRGHISRDPPRFAYLLEKAAVLAGAFGFRLHGSSSIIAVSEPQGCRLDAAVPWAEL